MYVVSSAIFCPPVGENVCDVMNKVGMCARSVSYVTSLFFGFLLVGSEPIWLHPVQRSWHSKRKIWCTNINKNDHIKPATANHRLTLPFCVWQNQYGCVLRCSGVETKTRYTDWQNDHIKLSDRNNYTFSAFILSSASCVRSNNKNKNKRYRLIEPKP